MKKSLLFLSTFLTLTLSSAKAADFLDANSGPRRSLPMEITPRNPYEFTEAEAAEVTKILEGCGVEEDDDVSKTPEVLQYLPLQYLLKEEQANEWDLKNDRDSLTASSIDRIHKMQPLIRDALEKKAKIEIPGRAS